MVPVVLASASVFNVLLVKSSDSFVVSHERPATSKYFYFGRVTLSQEYRFSQEYEDFSNSPDSFISSYQSKNNIDKVLFKMMEICFTSSVKQLIKDFVSSKNVTCLYHPPI